MDKTGERLLEAVRCALRGGAPDWSLPITEADWAALFQAAESHKLLPLVYEAAAPTPAFAAAPEGLRAAVKSAALRAVANQAARTAAFGELYAALLAAGAKPLVVKGLVCRSLYPKPDHRASADEDLFVDGPQFARCDGVLRARGFEAVGGDPDGFEASYLNRENGLLIEAHRALFSPESGVLGDMNRLFDGAAERAVEMDAEGLGLWTLEYTDHFLYLVCHALKHFIHSGFGVRQVCDVLIFAERCGGRIDWTRCLAALKTVRGEKFAAALFDIGEKHLGFDPEAARLPGVWRERRADGDALLADILGAGVYGQSDMSRRHSSLVTLAAAEGAFSGKRKQGLVRSLFPPASYLRGRYPYLRRAPVLLPAAWLSRLLGYVRESAGPARSAARESLELGRRRVELLREYGVIDE